MSDENGPGSLSVRNQTIGVYSGVATALLLLIGWCFLAQFLPPPSPNLTADSLVTYWRDGRVLKTAGLVVAMWGGVCYVPFTVAIAMQLLKIGRHVRFWVYTQAAAGFFSTIFFTVAFTPLLTVGFRLDRPAELTQLIADFGFILAFAPVQSLCLQLVAVGVAILQDRSTTPLFPRWVAYFNFWIAFAFVPGALIPFFKTGPFAWSGVFGFWIPVFTFVFWIFVMAWQCKRAIATLQLGRAPALAE